MLSSAFMKGSGRSSERPVNPEAIGEFEQIHRSAPSRCRRTHTHYLAYSFLRHCGLSLW
jgi:hypothetical protein